MMDNDRQEGSNRPVLVTGAHRSGTTWTGKLLATAEDLFYIHEPFHRSHAPGVCPVQIDRWFQFVSEHNENRHAPALRRTFDLRFSPARHVASVLQNTTSHFHEGMRGIAWALKEYGKWTWARVNGWRPLVKDPLALFSAEWIADRFDTQVIVLVRHPAGFAHSLQRTGWSHDFTNFIEQPELMKSLPAGLAQEIREAAEDPGDIVEQASLLWKVIYSTVASYQNRHPEWKVVRNEDLAVHPFQEFEKLCNFLDVPFDARMKQAVKEFTANRSPSSGETPIHKVRRNSRSEAWKWRRLLDRDTIERIREQTAPVWEEFYAPDEWKSQEFEGNNR